ncbi:MAG: DinB family protein [Chitinophagaceae bacterium]
MWQETGFQKSESDLPSAMKRLAVLMEEIKRRYETYSEDYLMYRPAPGKWSAKELLGHLIDSAINNLKPFTEIQVLPQPYVVKAYHQNELVIVNQYQQLPVKHLLNFWTALNHQIIYVVENISVSRLDYPVTPQYENGGMHSVGWIICDYVAHIEHHLGHLQ